MQLSKQYNILRKTGVALLYKGPFSETTIASLNELLKEKLIGEKKRNRILTVFVEMAQNVAHYSQERDEKSGIGILVLRRKAHNWELNCGNSIHPEKVSYLKERLEETKHLSPEELKEKYNIQIRSERPQDSKGAGLGFYEIARKSDLPLVFQFEKGEDGGIFFRLTARFLLIDKEEFSTGEGI
ncbi:hypothetical protein LEP1GSC050_4243 [Leptospira broomii serovar Hurstbridge str. 5399]|uniref:GHKL domain protein n=1 Tax=Leptospira broomii serovar Hurstbridge str. 5399 TaxID=1049789 RepID=T0F0Z0_9LEPT|nr:SiaB family protein kinase [Leptospira broomii]EQA44820.1 hypothetical protein LEP1GSC050_4243 [Leptospira broomii serovar Hurstbridge str. 5399]